MRRIAALFFAMALVACGGTRETTTQTTDPTTTPAPTTTTTSTTTPTTTTTTAAAEGRRAELLAKAEADPQQYQPPSEPRLSVTPSSGLVDGQVIAVLGEGLPAGEYIGIAACVPWDPASATGPRCLYTSSGAGTVDPQGRLWFPDYRLAALEPAIGFNCAEPPGCELAWYVGHERPARVTAPIDVTS